MRILAILSVPAIVLTSLLHAGVEPTPPIPSILALSKEERARVMAVRPAALASAPAAAPRRGERAIVK